MSNKGEKLMEQLNVKQAQAELRNQLPTNKLIFSLFKECTPKILVYTDGLSYGGSDFGLSDFINTLKGTVVHGMSPIVKTAHSGATAADYTNFIFTSSTLSKNKYDVLFLFGYSSGGSLPPAEISVISQFMNDGGGVFATGDHANLGKRLCGNIPRVKEMRRWAGPSAGGIDRISTNDPGADNAFQFADQSDIIPQKIYPAYTGTTASSEPHFLLQHPVKKVIEVLPDHPHESECILPASLADVSVWPKDGDGHDVSPEIVALSVSYGGGFPGKEPISVPRSFNAIVAYDGHKANIGRISTDATWHHFININLINTGDGPGLSGNPDAYNRVNTYFGNIAIWLMPKKVRRCLRWPLIITTIKLYPIAEFIVDLPAKPDLASLLELGSEMEITLSRFISPAQRKELVNDLFDLHSKELSKQISMLSREPTSIEEQIGQRTAPLELIEQAALGALTHAIATALPEDSDLESSLKAVGGIEGLDKKTKKSLKHAFKELASAIHKGRGSVDKILEHCK